MKCVWTKRHYNLNGLSTFVLAGCTFLLLPPFLFTSIVAAVVGHERSKIHICWAFCCKPKYIAFKCGHNRTLTVQQLLRNNVCINQVNWQNLTQHSFLDVQLAAEVVSSFPILLPSLCFWKLSMCWSLCSFLFLNQLPEIICQFKRTIVENDWLYIILSLLQQDTHLMDKFGNLVLLELDSSFYQCIAQLRIICVVWNRWFAQT